MAKPRHRRERAPITPNWSVQLKRRVTILETVVVMVENVALEDRAVRIARQRMRRGDTPMERGTEVVIANKWILERADRWEGVIVVERTP